MSDPTGPRDAEPALLVAKPTRLGRPEDWFEATPDRFVRLSEAVAGGGRWPDMDSALGAAMRGEHGVWVPCVDLEYREGRFAFPIADPFGRIEGADVARILRDGRAAIRGLSLSCGRVVLSEPTEVTAASLFIAAPQEQAETGGDEAKPQSKGDRHRRKAGDDRRDRKRSGPSGGRGVAAAETAPAAEEVQPAPDPEPSRPVAFLAPESGSSTVDPGSSTPPARGRVAAPAPIPFVPNPDRPDRMLRQPEVCAITGLSRTTIWRIEKLGEFPKRGVVARLGPRPHRPTEWPQSVQFRIASDSGIPRSVIRLRMFTPIIASLLCPCSDRDRSRGPRICLNRYIPFSARAC